MVSYFILAFRCCSCDRPRLRFFPLAWAEGQINAIFDEYPVPCCCFTIHSILISDDHLIIGLGESSAVGPSMVGELATAFIDALYKA